MTPVEGDTNRRTLTTRLDTPSARVLLQVLDRHGGTAFSVDEETVDLRAVPLERGHTATAYRSPAR